MVSTMTRTATSRRFTVSLPSGIIERARNTVFHSPGITLSSLSAIALSREIDRLEQLRGEAFPARNGPLRTGRPIS